MLIVGFFFHEIGFVKKLLILNEFILALSHSERHGLFSGLFEGIFGVSAFSCVRSSAFNLRSVIEVIIVGSGFLNLL
jgi:hypothetical protein